MFKPVDKAVGIAGLLVRRAKDGVAPRIAQRITIIGQDIRHAANRFTTFALRELYYYRLQGAELSLAAMLADKLPSRYGARDEAVFIALPGCEREVDCLLARGDGYSRTDVQVKQFGNSESYVRIAETVRGKKVVIFQNFAGKKVNDALMETLLAIDAAKRAGADSVVLVTPDIPYLEDGPGTANYEADYFKLVLNLFFKAGRLDELYFGPVALNRERSLLFLQDWVISRDLAPFLIAQSAHFLPKGGAGQSPQLLSMVGDGYEREAREIFNALQTKHQLRIRHIGISFTTDIATSKKSCNAPGSESLLGKTVYVFQTCNTGRVNDNFMETLMMIYTARKRGAKKIVLVMPYLPYNRQERKALTREPISAKMVMNALVGAAGAGEVVTVDLHSAATEGFVDTPFQHISGFNLLADLIKSGELKLPRNLVFVSPDVGRANTVRRLAERAVGSRYRMAIVNKKRIGGKIVGISGVIGDVRGKDVLVPDDIIDSGGTSLAVIGGLKKAGARRIYLAGIHPVFSDVNIRKDSAEYRWIVNFVARNNLLLSQYIRSTDDPDVVRVNALIRLQANPQIEGIIFTNTIDVPAHNIIDRTKVRVIPLTDLLATVCARIATGGALDGFQAEG